MPPAALCHIAAIRAELQAPTALRRSARACEIRMASVEAGDRIPQVRNQIWSTHERMTYGAAPRSKERDEEETAEDTEGETACKEDEESRRTLIAGTKRSERPTTCCPGTDPFGDEIEAAQTRGRLSFSLEDSPDEESWGGSSSASTDRTKPSTRSSSLPGLSYGRKPTTSPPTRRAQSHEIEAHEFVVVWHPRPPGWLDRLSIPTEGGWATRQSLERGNAPLCLGRIRVLWG